MIGAALALSAVGFSLAPGCAPLLHERACPTRTCSRLVVLETAAADVVRPELAQAAAQSFEPTFKPEQLGVVFFAIAVPFGYWWLITVPEQRRALAKDKRKGEVREYIAALKEDDSGRPLERWFFQKWLRQARPARRADEAAGAAQVRLSTLSDSREQEAQQPDAQTDAVPARRDPSLRELFAPASLRSNATPQFFSGDNPIVVTSGALLALGVLASSARLGQGLAVDAGILLLGIAFGLQRLGLK